MRTMNRMQITTLRQNLGWTQERLATESGVGVRTIQRLEAGHDASLETLSLVSALCESRCATCLRSSRDKTSILAWKRWHFEQSCSKAPAIG